MEEKTNCKPRLIDRQLGIKSAKPANSASVDINNDCNFWLAVEFS